MHEGLGANHVQLEVVAELEKDLVPHHSFTVFMWLPWLNEGLGHHDINRNLEEFKAMIFATHFLRYLHDFLKTKVNLLITGFTSKC